MRIFTFGDLHIYPYHQFSKPEEFGYTTRLKEHIEACKSIANYIEQDKPDLICCGGDIFHTQSKIDTIVLDCASECIDIINESCKRVGKEFHILVGNHDILSDNNKSSNSLIPFKKWNNIIIHESPEEYGEIVFLPYVTESIKLTDYVKGIKDKEEKTVLAHLDFKGAKYNDTMIDETGFETNLFYEFKKILGHHYHVPQRLRQGKFEFPGSPQVFSFREPKCGTYKRGIILYNSEDNTVNRRQVEAPDWITITDEDDIKEAIDSLSKNNYVRLLLSSDYALDEAGVTEDKIRDKFLNAEIQYDLDRISVINRIRSKSEREVNSGESEEDVLKDYINSRVDSEEERKKLIDVGIGILSKIRN